MKKKIIIELDEKEKGEIYNALCCLNEAIRDKQKERTKVIQKLIKEIWN